MCDERVRKALTEIMTVLPDMGGTARGVEDMYAVVSSSGNTYVVDAREGVCTCEDMIYNLDDGEVCKHVLRARYATGRAPIPVEFSADEGLGALDDSFGEHVDGTIEVETPDETSE
jgi:hypothetical protein